MSARHLDIVYSEDHDLLVDHIFERVECRLAVQPDQRAFLVVPEPMKADMERHFIAKTRVGGIMLTEILSFRRLATRLFSESGVPMPDLLSNAGKAILTQKILLDQEIPFRTFKRMAGQPRYAAELVHILGDFRRYGISSEELLEIDSRHHATLDKFHDFALLKDALENELARRDLSDPDCTLTSLAALLLDSPLPKRLDFLSKTHIWVVGFGADRQFTSQEMDVLRGLASHVSGMTVTVTADYPGGNRGALAFQHGRATIDTLSRVFPGIRIARPDVPDETRAHHAEMETPRREIRLIGATDVHEEARYAAGLIRELLLRRGIRRKDIGIALCDERLMSNVMETTLAEYGVDAWIDTRKSLSQSSFARTFAALLSLCSYDFSFDTLMDYYRGGLSPLSDDIVDSFENAALALGWTTARDFRLLMTSPELLDGDLANRFQGSDQEWRDVRRALEDVFSLLNFTSNMRELRNGYAKSELLLDFLFSESAGSPEKRVMERRDALMEQNRRDSATLLVSSWNATIDLLLESQELLGKTRISQDHYTQLLLAGLEGLVLPSVPLGADHVRVGSLRAMATWPCRVLFILGATASAFPPASQQQGYLRDEERDLLSKETNKPFPSRQKDEPASQAWLLHMLLTRPSQALYVSAPSLGDNQSYVFDDLRDLASSDMDVVTEPGVEPDVRWYALPAALRITRWNAEAPAAWKAAVARMTKSDRALPAPAHTVAESTQLPAEIATRSIEPQSGVSVSRIQQYNACPFRYFAEYIARAMKRTVAEDEPNAQGTLLHSLMELATKDLINRLRHAETAEKAGEIAALWRRDVDSANYMRAIYRAATDKRGLGWYARPSLSGSIGERLRLYAAKTIQGIATFSLNDGYAPLYLEWYFPNVEAEPYRLCVGSSDFTLRGLIDRIEENRDGQVRIIDFKRTGKDFDWLSLYDGTDVQLPLYKLAFETAYPDKKVEELYFCGFERPDARDLDSYDGVVPDRNETIRQLDKQKKNWEHGVADRAAQFAEKKAVQTIHNIFSGAFPARPTIRGASNSPCRYCGWRAACGYDHRLERNKPLPNDRDTEKAIRQEILGECGAEITD